LDAGDSVTVLTPYAKSQPDAASFSTSIGTGQGDAHSPLVWIAIMDILLTAVTLSCPSDVFYPLFDGKVGTARDISFADDKISLASRLTSLQRKATTYSAATQIFRLDLAASKFRAFAITRQSGPHHLIVYGRGWEPKVVNMEEKGAIKYLGSLQDLNQTGKSDYGRMKSELSSTRQRLAGKACGITGVMRYVKGALIPKLAYIAKYSAVSIAKLQKLDCQLGQLFKHKLMLPKNFPDALLFGRRDQGGLGVPLLSQELMLAKVRTFHNVLRSPDFATRHAIEGMLYRMVLCTGQLHCERYLVKASPYNCWLQNIAHFCDIHKLCLRYRPSPMLRTNLTPGDIFTYYENNVENIVSIIGWSSHHYYVHKWERQNICPRSGLRPQYNNLTCDYVLHRLLHTTVGQWSKKLLISRKNMYEYQSHHMEELVAHTAPFVLPPVIPVVATIVSVPREPGAKYSIYTDGSWNQVATGPFDGQSVITSGGAVVIMEDSGRRILKSFRIPEMYVTSKKRAYVQEYVALQMGFRIRAEFPSAHVYTDCQSARTSLLSPAKLRNTALQDPRCPFRSLTHTGNSLHETVHHVRAHADRRKVFAALDTAEYGNLVADAVAEGSRRFPYTDLSAEDINQHLELCNSWVFSLAGSSQIIVDPLRELLGASDLEAYCQKKAADLKVHFSADQLTSLCSKPGLTMKQHSALLRLHFHKYWDDEQYSRHEPAWRGPCTCGCANVLNTWVSTCKRSDVLETLKATRSKLANLLSSFPRIWSILQGILQSEDAHLLWRGIWTPRWRTQISAVCSPPVGENHSLYWKKIQATTRSVGNILTDAALSLRSSSKTPDTGADVKKWSRRKRTSPTLKDAKQDRFEKCISVTGMKSIREYFPTLPRLTDAAVSETVPETVPEVAWETPKHVAHREGIATDAEPSVVPLTNRFMSLVTEDDDIISSASSEDECPALAAPPTKHVRFRTGHSGKVSVSTPTSLLSPQSDVHTTVSPSMVVRTLVLRPTDPDSRPSALRSADLESQSDDDIMTTHFTSRDRAPAKSYKKTRKKGTSPLEPLMGNKSAKQPSTLN
jgi:hypothetical protein